MRNNPEIDEYSDASLDLNSEQQEMKSEADGIMERFEKETDSSIHKEKMEEIKTFIHKMESEDYSPLKYTLGRRLLGINIDESVIAFDTENNDMYKFIKSLENGPEKLIKLFGMMSEIVNNLKNQNDADELQESIDSFKEKFDEESQELKNYAYGEILLHPGKIIDNNAASAFNDYDTNEDGEIAGFIRKLYKQITA